MAEAKKTTNRIRAIRKQQHLKLADLAARTGLSVQHLSRIENGHRRLMPDVQMRIARALDVPPLALIEEDSCPNTLPLLGELHGGIVRPDGLNCRSLRIDLADSRLMAIIDDACRPPKKQAIICRRLDHPREGLEKQVAVKTRDGQILFGHLLKGSAPGLYTVLTEEAAYYDLQAEWAARVEWIVQRP